MFLLIDILRNLFKYLLVDHPIETLVTKNVKSDYVFILKVQKCGSVGRCIDVTRYKGYDELRHDLARMFGIEGQLEDPLRTDWKLVYVDHENDILLVGDDPWE